jgi:hypothetical protein
MSLEESKYQMKSFITAIAGTNYYNEKHQIIRVDIGGEWFDCKYMGGVVVPHPNDHVALVITCEEFMKKTKSVQGSSKDYLPGISNSDGDTKDIPFGFVFPVPRNQQVAGSNASSGGAAFAINNTNMFDIEKVAIALTPPLNVDYTNKDKETDFKDFSNGIFVNKDGTILIKSHASSITMGKEGMYLGGDIHWESIDQNKEWMRDNGLANFIPLTLVTIPMSMPLFPNMEKFLKLAEGANKVINICVKTEKIIDLLGNVA